MRVGRVRVGREVLRAGGGLGLLGFMGEVGRLRLAHVLEHALFSEDSRGPAPG